MKQSNTNTMKTFENLNSEKIDMVLSMTGFNYDIQIISNEDGTENIIFNSKTDALKFYNLYNVN